MQCISCLRSTYYPYSRWINKKGAIDCESQRRHVEGRFCTRCDCTVKEAKLPPLFRPSILITKEFRTVPYCTARKVTDQIRFTSLTFKPLEAGWKKTSFSPKCKMPSPTNNPRKGGWHLFRSRKERDMAGEFFPILVLN